jgi:serine/threonine-protein kinase
VADASAPPTPGFAPAIAPAPAPAAKAGKSHRGLWIGLGAVTAVLALVAVAALVPRFLAAHAGQNAASQAPAAQTSPDASSAAQTSPAADAQGAAAADASQQAGPFGAAAAAASSTAAAPADQSGAAAAPSASPTPFPAPSPHPSGKKSKQASIDSSQTAAGTSSATTASAPPPPSGPSPDEVREVRDKLITLSARAEAANTGVQQIRSQQQAQGLDMRGDILASISRMNSFITEANRALSENDLAAANQYIQRADREVSTLEKFLGR